MFFLLHSTLNYHRTLMLKFKNKAFLSLSLLLIAQLINDWCAITIGFPTPVQIIMILSIILLPWKLNKSKDFCKIRNYIVYYLFFILLSFSLINYSRNSLFQLLSIVINSIYLLRIIQNFKQKAICYSDLLNFFNTILLSIVFITIPSGIIELVTHKNILNFDKGLSDALFYIRGLHIDKIDFGTYLSLGSFVGLGMLFSNAINFYYKFLSFIVIVFSLLLVALSFSTTSIIGLGFGLLIIFILSPIKSTFQYVMISIFLIAIFSGLVKTDLAKMQIDAYELKYNLQVEHYKERNSRYMMLSKSVSLFSESPLWGHGFDRSAYLFQKVLKWYKPLNAHNFFANELINNGVLGFIPLFLLFFNFFYLSIKAVKDNKMYVNFKFVNFSFIGAGLSCFILFRLMLYYHNFNNTIYIIWSAIVFSLYKFYQNLPNNFSKFISVNTIDQYK